MLARQHCIVYVHDVWEYIPIVSSVGDEVKQTIDILLYHVLWFLNISLLIITCLFVCKHYHNITIITIHIFNIDYSSGSYTVNYYWLLF